MALGELFGIRTPGLSDPRVGRCSRPLGLTVSPTPPKFPRLLVIWHVPHYALF